MSKEMMVDCLTRDGKADFDDIYGQVFQLTYILCESGSAVGGDGKTKSADFVRRSPTPSKGSAPGVAAVANKNTVRFNTDQEVAFCIIDVINDSHYEEEETFVVYLDRVVGGRLISGENDTTVTIIADAADGNFN